MNHTENHVVKVEKNFSSETTEQDSSSSEKENNQSAETIINHTVSLAKEGKIEIAPFVAGKTKVSEVTREWGDPKQESPLDTITYEDYPNHVATIGVKNNVVMDLRSWGSNLKEIHYKDIIKMLGEAEEIKYYQDEIHDQVILSYLVNANYELKWILPKPTKEADNPAVDHISIVSTQQLDDSEQTSIDQTEMSFDEKIGQMIIAGVEGTSMQANNKQLITEYHIGGVIFYSENLLSYQQSAKFIQRFKEINRSNRHPLLISVDQEGGEVSRVPGVEKIPSSASIGKRGDADYAYDIGVKLGEQLKSAGFNVDFAPVLDINSNPNNPVIGDRSYGDNPSLVSKMGIQTMHGIQSKNIIAVIKHFPGHGDTSVDSHMELPKVVKPLKELEKFELVPFKNAIQSGADVVMVAHILNPKLDQNYPASLSKAVITDILRNDLSFDGVVITDDLTMGAIMKHYDIGEAAVQSIKAGSDILLVAHDYTKVVQVIERIKEAVRDGEISEERINESVNRITKLKEEYLRS